MSAPAAVKERPIIFSGDSVRAIIDGRKTQTRRPIKDVPRDAHTFCRVSDGWVIWCGGRSCGDQAEYDRFTAESYPEGGGIRCPYGQPGNRLWVRETWQFVDGNARHRNTAFVEGIPSARLGPAAPWKGVQDTRPITWRAMYRADGPAPEHKLYGNFPWNSPVYMPRWASRLLLEVTDVRVQRLQEISEQDAQAEGVPFDGTYWLGGLHLVKGTLQCWPTASEAFARAWDVINGKRATWSSNPWVWAITFRVVHL